MVIGRIVFLYFWAIATSLAMAAQDVFTPDVDEEPIDSTGLVWAAKHYGNQLYTYDGQSWKPAPSGLSADIPAEFRGMVKGDDGAVVVAWVVKGEGLAVTRHLGDSSTVLASEKGDQRSIPNLIHPTIDSKGFIWMSGSFPRIYKTDGKGGINLVHEFTPEDFRSREKKRMLGSDLYNPIHTEEDGAGRMWVWSGTSGVHISHWGPNPNLDPLPSLHGIYIVSDDKWELHDDFGAIQGGDILCVARFDDQHMIISDSENGVYKIDIQNWKTQNLPGPPWDLRNVNELFVDGGDLYALDRNSGTKLWRWSNEQWSEVVSDFEHTTNGIGHSPRARLRIKEGMILQGFERTWLIPNTGPARMLSWKSAFPIPQIKAIVQLKDGTFCILGAQSQIYYCGLADSVSDLSSHRVVELEEDQAWLASSHIWMIPRKDMTALKEWDGKTWLIHQIPTAGRGAKVLTEDDQRRIWVCKYDGTVDVFDSTNNQWQSFSDMDSCLTAIKERPIRFLNGGGPKYSSDKKRISYYDGDLHYFDASAWRVFRWTDITGWPGNGYFNQPWFDAKDNLFINNQANNLTWKFTESGQWTSLPHIERPTDSHDPTQKIKYRIDKLPEGCPILNPFSIQTDNLGVFWFTKDGNLYRCIGDQYVPVFEPKEITPFNTNQTLLDVFVDSQGNAFIKALAADTRRYLILAKHPAPQTTIELKPKEEEDSYVATFNPHSDGVVSFRWQLDDGAWQMTKADSLELSHLPNGPHILRVTAIDDQLMMDATPAVAKFETQIDTGRQMKTLLAQLVDPDYSKRQLAVEAFARQSGNALPILQKARETANDDQRWWIDVAIQECKQVTNETEAKPTAAADK